MSTTPPSPASGITTETVLKYRDIDVGKVEKVTFSPGLEVVVVALRVDKEIAPYLDDDAEFWVVRPNVTLRGVSGGTGSQMWPKPNSSASKTPHFWPPKQPAHKLCCAPPAGRLWHKGHRSCTRASK